MIQYSEFRGKSLSREAERKLGPVEIGGFIFILEKKDSMMKVHLSRRYCHCLSGRDSSYMGFQGQLREGHDIVPPVLQCLGTSRLVRYAIGESLVIKS